MGIKFPETTKQKWQAKMKIRKKEKKIDHSSFGGGYQTLVVRRQKEYLFTFVFFLRVMSTSRA